MKQNQGTHMFPKNISFLCIPLHHYHLHFNLNVRSELVQVKITSGESFLQGRFCSEGAAGLSLNTTIHSPLLHIQTTVQIFNKLCAWCLGKFTFLGKQQMFL